MVVEEDQHVSDSFIVIRIVAVLEIEKSVCLVFVSKYMAIAARFVQCTLVGESISHRGSCIGRALKYDSRGDSFFYVFKRR